MAKFFRVPWALSGTKTAIPDVAPADGSVSYPSGWGVDYERNPVTDPQAKLLPRPEFNQAMFDVTDALRVLQVQGSPDFITAADNGGTAFAYQIGAVVRYNNKNWVSQVANNTALPAQGAQWRELNAVVASDLAATQAEVNAATVTDKFVAPSTLRGGVRATTLTGLDVTSGVAVVATDTFLAAVGKLQKQATDLAGGRLKSIIAGSNISVDNSDPLNPVISAPGSDLVNAPPKTTPVPADLAIITDSEDANAPKRVTLQNIRNLFQTFFDTRYTALGNWLPLTGGTLSGGLIINSPNGMAINAASAFYIRSDETKQMVFQNAAGTAAKGFIRSLTTGAMTIVPVDAANNARTFSFNTNGQLALPVTSTANDAAVRRDDMLARITEVNNSINTKPTAGWIDIVGLWDNDVNQPFMRRKSDGARVSLQPALWFTPVQQTGNNKIQLYWTGRLTYDVDNGAAAQQLVDAGNFQDFADYWGCLRQNRGNYTLGAGAGGGSGQLCLTMNMNSSGVSLRTADRGQGKGDISLNSNGTVTYGSTSDYRLKENVVTLVDFSLSEAQFAMLDPALLRVMSMRPVSFNFIGNVHTLHGFIAHELQAPSPHAVTGVKDGEEPIGTATIAGAVTPAYSHEVEDGVDDEGNVIKKTVTVPEKREPDTVHKNVAKGDFPEAKSWKKTGTRPVYQQVDTSQVVPDLTAAIQSLTLLVIDLHERLDALEGTTNATD